MLQDLIHREWHTSEKIRTDENGTAVLTGFKGTYSLTGEKACGNFHLGQEKECITVTCSPWK